jgi:molybdopterin/thiamine biosynthesis adenylyltransferase/rhodanese-related sulfurtransferase
MDKDLIERYSRHILIPEIGLKRQKDLQEKSALVVGLGGLGCVQSIYLASAGVGRIGLIDGDIVDKTNLQRQILYHEKDIGKSKVALAEQYLNNLNSNVEFKTYEQFLNSDNAIDIIQEFDIIIDGTDNFSSHYLINDACVLVNKNHTFGSIFRFDGQVSFFNKTEGPCYRCLYPHPPQAGDILDCEAGGVLNHLPGIIGLIQSTEALKYLLGITPTLIGELMVVDTLMMDFRKFHFEKDMNCSVCGIKPEIKDLQDYESKCGFSDVLLNPEKEISAKELYNRIRNNETFTLLDVRESEEYQLTRLPGALSFPFNILEKSLNQIKTDEEIIIYCRSGIRSARATLLLKELGYNRVKYLTGGIREYAEKFDPSLIMY